MFAQRTNWLLFYKNAQQFSDFRNNKRVLHFTKIIFYAEQFSIFCGKGMIAHLKRIVANKGEKKPITHFLCQLYPQGADRLPTSSTRGKAGRKSTERGNYPPPPHWDRRAIFSAKP
jgi:hypothetical protein